MCLLIELGLSNEPTTYTAHNVHCHSGCITFLAMLFDLHVLLTVPDSFPFIFPPILNTGLTLSTICLKRQPFTWSSVPHMYYMCGVFKCIICISHMSSICIFYICMY